MLVSSAAYSNKKHPLLFLPSFVEDLVNGMYSRKMMDKYYIHTYNDFNLLASSTLKFVGTRSRSPDEDCRVKNLAIRGWKRQYDLLTSQFELFRPQLVDMFNCSLLRTLVAHAVLRLEYIPYGDVERSVLESYNVLKKYLHIPQDASFDNYMGDDLVRKIDSTVAHLAQESMLTSIDGNVSMPAKYAQIQSWIRDIIESNKSGVRYQSLIPKIFKKFPLLRMIPGRDAIDNTLDILENDGSIICKRAFWKFAPHSNLLFSVDHYKASLEKMRSQMASLGRTKFFGRRITPDRFISELRILEPGDIDDRDDQVTRIAGLMLSDAISVKNPTDHIPEFDFVMDFTGYNFRPKQIAMMRRLGFKIHSKIFHCKVSINDEITVRDIDELREAISDGEQGVVFTCGPVRPDVERHVRGDKTIQIIDESGIRAWYSITSTMPCRLSSIARVMYGDSRGNAVLIKSANYESGIATVEVAPERKEMAVPIGCLEEIGPDLSNSVEADPTTLTPKSDDVIYTEVHFAAASEEYFEFLCNVASLAQNTFEDGLVLSVRAIYTTRLDLIKSLKKSLKRTKMFDRLHQNINTLRETKYIRYAEFEHGIYSIINIQPSTMDKPFVCSCGHKLNETYRFTLCSHLVAAIIKLGLEDLGDWKSTKQRIRALREGLCVFRMQNVKRIALTMRDVIDDGSTHLLEEYIRSHLLIYSDDEENQNATNNANLSSAEKYIHDLLKADSEMLDLFRALKIDILNLDEASLRRVIRALHH